MENKSKMMRCEGDFLALESPSMEMTDEIIDFIMMMNDGMTLSEIYDGLIFASGNSEEFILRVIGLDKYYLEGLFTYIMNAIRTAEVVYSYDTKRAKKAIKMLGHDVHCLPFQYLATQDYFCDEDYKAIVDVVKFINEKEDEWEVEEDV